MGYIGCDFDKTAYGGNSAIDFFLFCMKSGGGLRWFALKHLGNYLLYLLGLRDFHQITEKFYRFLPKLEDIDRLVEEFWNAHMQKLRQWFLSLDMSKVVILTASCGFLLESLQKRLGFHHLIATRVDKQTGCVTGQANIREEKLLRFQQECEGQLDEFYSDSKKDAPLAARARRAFRVKKERITPWSFSRGGSEEV